MAEIERDHVRAVSELLDRFVREVSVIAGGGAEIGGVCADVVVRYVQRPHKAHILVLLIQRVHFLIGKAAVGHIDLFKLVHHGKDALHRLSGFHLDAGKVKKRVLGADRHAVKLERECKIDRRVFLADRRHLFDRHAGAGEIDTRELRQRGELFRKLRNIRFGKCASGKAQLRGIARVSIAEDRHGPDERNGGKLGAQRVLFCLAPRARGERHGLRRRKIPQRLAQRVRCDGDIVHGDLRGAFKILRAAERHLPLQFERRVFLPQGEKSVVARAASRIGRAQRREVVKKRQLGNGEVRQRDAFSIRGIPARADGDAPAHRKRRIRRTDGIKALRRNVRRRKIELRERGEKRQTGDVLLRERREHDGRALAVDHRAADGNVPVYFAVRQLLAQTKIPFLRNALAAQVDLRAVAAVEAAGVNIHRVQPHQRRRNDENGDHRDQYPQLFPAAAGPGAAGIGMLGHMGVPPMCIKFLLYFIL